MVCFRSRMTRLALAILCGVTFISAQTALADGHVISSADLRGALKTSAQQRQANVISVQKFLGSELGHKATKASTSHRCGRRVVGILGSMDLKVSYGVDLRNGRALLFSRTTP